MNELSSCIAPQFQCYLMPYEVTFSNRVLARHKVICYAYIHHRIKGRIGAVVKYRIIIPGIAGIVLHQENSKRYAIQGIYVIPEKRKQGIARQLIALCHLAFNATIAHSEHLTNDGRLAFIDDLVEN